MSQSDDLTEVLRLLLDICKQQKLIPLKVEMQGSKKLIIRQWEETLGMVCQIEEEKDHLIQVSDGMIRKGPIVGQVCLLQEGVDQLVERHQHLQVHVEDNRGRPMGRYREETHLTR